MNIVHEPVLLEEVVRELHIKNQGKYIDCTLGAGGYTKAICEEGGRVLAIETDESMIQIASKNLVGKDVQIVHGNFRKIKEIAKESQFLDADGIVFDLGVSNVHFSDEERGFSFRNPESLLDMRLDIEGQAVKASDLLNGLREDQLQELFGRNLSEKIVTYRLENKFEKVKDFLSLFPERRASDKIHPATKAFMMLRIAVNSELDNLRESLPQAYEVLKEGGRLVVVSFHSLEDEIVKDFMREKGVKNEFFGPSDEEIKRNPKSRSAKLRVLVKR